ncbi:MAG TPA: hypothetical protein VMK53_10805 [Gemmatimonadales bacterium]|nr:hypothetical protein [Gemmatimonadales bacterium]
MGFSTRPVRLFAWLLGLAVMVGVAAASHAPWRAHPEPTGVLRLNLSARPERLERCRTLSEEELASRPAHMRQPVICDGESATYRLVVTRDGAPLVDAELSGGGARRDRPIHLLREYPIPVGTVHLSVTLDRVEAADAVVVDSGTANRITDALPRALRLDTTVTVASHRVVMVTYEPRQRHLVALTGIRNP